MSSGFYIRQNYGKEYEIGVALGSTIWVTSIHMATGPSASVTITWSIEAGLAVTVDGFRAATNVAGETRMFTNPPIDPFPDIVAGQANDDVNGTAAEDIAIWNVTFSSRKLNDTEIDVITGNQL